MRVMLVGGGTGGHFYPLIAIAEAVRETHDESVALYYIGPEPYDAAALAALNVRYLYCPSGKRRKYFSIRNFIDTFKILAGLIVAVVKLYIIYPDVLMSKGSYTSVPVVLAAAFLRIPIVIHESDAKPGSANKLAKRFARYIAISYDDAAAYFPAEKVALTGIPIRQTFLTPTSDPFGILGIPSDRPVVFVTGGSSGAERINTLILDSLDELLAQYTVVHQAGDKNADGVIQTALARNLPQAHLEHYFVFPHLTGVQMAACYDVASLVIARAGSTSIAEIALKSKPSILIPIPEEVSHDQRTNAYAYARSGAASVIEEKNLTDGLLMAEITRILGDSATVAAMSAAAARFTTGSGARTLADTLVSIAAEH